MRLLLNALAVIATAVVAHGHLWAEDLKRARTWTPRSGFRGRGTLASANAQLNRHLSARAGIKLKACEDFAVTELREVLRALFVHTSDELKELYAQHDGRRSVYASISEMENHWERSADPTDHRVRDAHCHEAVMWFVHHLPSETQWAVSQRMVLPLLPVADHTVADKGLRSETDAAGKFYDEKVTCQKCHNGGIANLGLPEEKPETAKAKARRCYTNYKELYNITCGPCDGIAGPYSGDDDKYFTPVDCIVVGKPEEIPESERVKPKLPAQFTADIVGGSDRFGRTTNPIHDTLPKPVARIYGQISGKWYMDAKPGADLWMLRHDTVYEKVTENGFPIPFIAPKVTEIHAQTKAMRSSNVTGPMVSLIDGMPSWIPGGCTCIPDPVGVPDITATEAKGLGEMKYMGRIRLPKLEYLETSIELDHWADWFFHIFMDVNKSMPHYGKAPSRLASAYAGTAVYANWIFEDPKIKDPEIWRRGIPTSPQRFGPDKGKFCMNSKKDPICDDISQNTFPPGADVKQVELGATATTSEPRLPFFPGQHALDNLMTQLQKSRDSLVEVIV
eukprot:TRINITY_DN2056_c0_g2_i1.p1 TRINITY_DN2056_c0_g2~~TRINITY_DN2056_c0_g2_i1.p1  ORF type:complete len:563 (-),score=82.70 TRINITY_DN2056_c0_g2_i1:202-1890(-)